MSPKFSRLNRRYTFYILIIMSVLLLAIPGIISNHIKSTITSPFAPVQKIISLTANYFKNKFEKIASMAELAGEEKKLKEEIFLLENKIVKQQNTIKVFKKQLKAVSKFRNDVNKKEKPLFAAIIGYDSSNYRKGLLIDAGRKHGISIDDVVVMGNALVGRVSSIGRSSSRVRLITDPESNVPSKFLKSRVQCIVKGMAKDICMVKYVPRHVQVKTGDKVITSGIGGVFIKNIYVGDVVEVNEWGSKLFKEIKLKPRINSSKIEHVMVIKKTN